MEQKPTPQWVNDYEALYLTVKENEHGEVGYYNSDGKLHRDNDLPALTIGAHYKAWYQHGLLHRDGDKPAEVDEKYELQAWLLNGNYHRDDDKPAIIGRDLQEWWINGRRHRDDGKPAIIDSHRQEWWINGVQQRGMEPL